MHPRKIPGHVFVFLTARVLAELDWKWKGFFSQPAGRSLSCLMERFYCHPNGFSFQATKSLRLQKLRSHKKFSIITLASWHNPVSEDRSPPIKNVGRDYFQNEADGLPA